MPVLRWLWKHFLTRPGWVAVAGLVVVIAGVALSSVGIKRAGVVVIDTGAVVALLGGVIWVLRFLNRALPDGTRIEAMVMIDVTALLFFVVFPQFLLALATSGNSLRSTFAILPGSEAGKGVLGTVTSAVALACLVVNPALLVAIPEMLRRYRPWTYASSRAKSLLPSWLAAVAAVATWGYIFLLHWFGGPLSTTAWGPLAVGAFAAAVLLVPLYQFVARSCWEHGVEVVFDPGRWRAAYRSVRDEVVLARRRKVAATVRKNVSDLVSQVHREIKSGGTVCLRRHYDAPAKDVWDACIDPGRISRWFRPITGDLHLGGTYQLADGYGGKVLRCEPVRLLLVTFARGHDPPPKLEVQLKPDQGGSTELEVKHTAIVDPTTWAKPGYGRAVADFTRVLLNGVRWDRAMVGLSRNLSDVKEGHGLPWHSDEGEEFFRQSTDAWRGALEAAGIPAVQANAAMRWAWQDTYGEGPGPRVLVGPWTSAPGWSGRTRSPRS